jgi:hypothetical protein
MSNQFLGKDHSISLDEAKKMTKKFKEDKDKVVRDEYKGKNLLPVCESFDRAAFDKLIKILCRQINLQTGYHKLRLKGCL